MAEGRRYGLTPQLDIEQILLEAQHRWLRPAEICEILRNYRQFHIAPEPPNRPPSGSLFLFDRKVLRYFRKDGHNWRKKKDGKTVKEAHERLKAGSVDVLHCYYAHGEEDESFQRRSYWMLEEDFMHIVLVHYLEVKGGKSFNRIRETEGIVQVAPMDSPACSNSFTNQSRLPSQTADLESLDSGQTSEYEDAESDIYSTRTRYYPFPEMQQYDDGPVMDSLLNIRIPGPSIGDQYDYQEIQVATPNPSFYSVSQENIAGVFDESGLGLTFSGSKTQFDLSSWDEVMKHCMGGLQVPSFDLSAASSKATFAEDGHAVEPLMFGEPHSSELNLREFDAKNSDAESLWQISSATGSLVTSNSYVDNDGHVEESISNSPITNGQPSDLSDTEADGLKKYDSFSRWMSKELGEVDESQMKTSSEVYWNNVETDSALDDSNISSHENLYSYIVSPMLSPDQLFSIIDFSPSWAYEGYDTKVLVSGHFLKNEEEIERCRWSCMFGEVEVPAEVLADGTLQCYAPKHKCGRVPFYITCSNRLACSEVREFEFRPSEISTSDFYSGSMDDMYLHLHFEKLLSLAPVGHQNPVCSEKIDLITMITSLMTEDDEWSNSLKFTDEEGFSTNTAENPLLENLMKERLHSWLLQKVIEGGKGPAVLDEEGQGVLHLAAALGYDWALKPIIAAGVNINFRDARGWTALHWAAFCGRERTVVALIALGAATGALTDPTPEFPSGRTPADLASANGHKGIAGFLAESSLISHLRALTIKDSKGGDLSEIRVLPGLNDVAGERVVALADEDPQAGSLKDSLSAVRNAAQAAARIYQVFRVQSFQRKKLTEYGDDKHGLSDEQALLVLSIKAAKTGQNDMALHAAAIRIQNKFRGWKGRKEFLLIRQRIVKIQAHVRGHQVRKHFRKIVWSVGIVEKAILRWRRKGSGLRGFRSKGLLEGPVVEDRPAEEDDFDFLLEGRRQNEARLQKDLARVKSMVQYPEARDQYRRLITIVTQLQESKAIRDRILNESEETDDSDLMVELKELLEDDTPMPSIQ